MSPSRSPNPDWRPVTRRELLRGAVAGAGLVALGACHPGARSVAADLARAAEAAGPVTEGRGTIRGLRRAGALEVAPGDALTFDPSADTTLELTGNLVVLGRLEMRPEPGVEHVLRFVDVDESAFVGGGLEPLDTDVGLWVMGDGVLDISGTPKQAWNRTGTSGSWLRRDELVVAPVEAGDTTPKPFHAADPVPASGDRRAEVLNLTRNARIEGTPTGRAHVFIRSERPQSIRYAALRYLGPRQASGESTEGVLGRYGLHFHHAHDGSRGSVVQGVVVRDCGSHAFVPHMSHGITIRNCIAYETFDEAYWWDPHDPTDDLVIDRCVAASVHFDPEERGFRLAGFMLGLGNRIKLQRSVAFAVHGNRNAAGYVWPEAPSGLWDFHDNLAHNNAFAGIFVWQNVRASQRIRRFTAYHNGAAGILHGAYSNSFHYEDLDLTDQPNAIDLIAAGRPDMRGRPQSWTDVHGGSLRVESHNLPGDSPVLFRRCSFPGGVTLDDAAGEPGPLDFVDCGLEPENLSVVSLNAGTVVRVQRADDTAFELTATGVTDIRPFFPY